MYENSHTRREGEGTGPLWCLFPDVTQGETRELLASQTDSSGTPRIPADCAEALPRAVACIKAVLKRNGFRLRRSEVRDLPTDVLCALAQLLEGPEDPGTLIAAADLEEGTRRLASRLAATVLKSWQRKIKECPFDDAILAEGHDPWAEEDEEQPEQRTLQELWARLSQLSGAVLQDESVREELTGWATGVACERAMRKTRRRSTGRILASCFSGGTLAWLDALSQRLGLSCVEDLLWRWMRHPPGLFDLERRLTALEKGNEDRRESRGTSSPQDLLQLLDRRPRTSEDSPGSLFFGDLEEPAPRIPGLQAFVFHTPEQDPGADNPTPRHLP